jgi:putative FmdB family regulatory protein
MPMHDFRCDDCGEEFERIVPSNKSMIRCIHCPSGMAFKMVPKTFGYRRDRTIHDD